jgi:hypothetical protein
VPSCSVSFKRLFQVRLPRGLEICCRRRLPPACPDNHLLPRQSGADDFVRFLKNFPALLWLNRDLVYSCAQLIQSLVQMIWSVTAGRVISV